MSPRLDPTCFAGALRDEHADVPPGLTLAEWRARADGRRKRARRSWWARRWRQG
jgi:hypothetical protein